METPLSSRRVTRSQTLSSATNSNIPISKKVEDSANNGEMKSRHRKPQDSSDRSALIDITNDSPIVGVAAGNMKTPVSSVAKQRSCRPKMMMTPGSGEALLRGQVKTLLQKVEEEAEISKLSLESRPFIGSSPVGLLAPTPANTPYEDGNLIQEEEEPISQVISDLFEGKNQEIQITRSLLLDFSEKSDLTDASSDCSSVLTHQEPKEKPSSDDENSSVWSVQVNASTRDEDDDEDLIEEHEEHEEQEDEEEEEEDYGAVEELCRGLSRISVDERGRAAEFAGKHTRFVYDSDGELVEEVSDESAGGDSSGVLRLKGLPTPKGKHVRFPAEENGV